MCNPTVLVMAAAAFAVASASADDRAPPRDPTQPYAHGGAAIAGVPSGPRFKLTAVLISNERRVAIVNGKPSLQGDRVDGAEIVRIEASAVHLRENGIDIVVPLGSKAPASALKSQGETAP